MTIDHFLELMSFPPLWRELDMIDQDYVLECIARYRPGHEDASEHDRHSLFQFWLKREPTKTTLLNLAKLSFVDPDQQMAASVRSDILRSANCDAEVESFLRSGAPP